jgi:hypothetical protein
MLHVSFITVLVFKNNNYLLQITENKLKNE